MKIKFFFTLILLLGTNFIFSQKLGVGLMIGTGEANYITHRISQVDTNLIHSSFKFENGPIGGFWLKYSFADATIIDLMGAGGSSSGGQIFKDFDFRDSTTWNTFFNPIAGTKTSLFELTVNVSRPLRHLQNQRLKTYYGYGVNSAFRKSTIVPFEGSLIYPSEYESSFVSPHLFGRFDYSFWKKRLSLDGLAGVRILSLGVTRYDLKNPLGTDNLNQHYTYEMDSILTPFWNLGISWNFNLKRKANQILEKTQNE